MSPTNTAKLIFAEFPEGFQIKTSNFFDSWIFNPKFVGIGILTLIIILVVVLVLYFVINYSITELS